MKRIGNLFGEVVAFENLHRAFRLAARGKRRQPDVIRYRYGLEGNLLALRETLLAGGYAFGPYRSFAIRDPKPRRIVAAPFEDRIVHHAMCNLLAPVFEPTFVADTYACIEGRGTHAAVFRLQHFLRRPGAAFALQCDIRKYFQSVDHAILKALVRRKVKDRRLLALVDAVVDSAPGDPSFGPGKGLPIGNLTSQLFANVYLSPLDHFVKEDLRVKGYVRYVDDFVLVGGDKRGLREAKAAISRFLAERLALGLHEDKSQVFPARRGVTFLGYRVWPYRLRMRTSTMVRMRRREKEVRAQYWNGDITAEDYRQTVSSLLGYLKWGDRTGALAARLLS